MSLSPDLIHSIVTNAPPLHWYNPLDYWSAFFDVDECINSHNPPRTFRVILASLGAALIIIFPIFFGLGSIIGKSLDILSRKEFLKGMSIALVSLLVGGAFVTYADEMYLHIGENLMKKGDLTTFKLSTRYSLVPVTLEARDLLKSPAVMVFKIVSYDDKALYMEPVFSQASGHHAVFSIGNRRFLSKIGYSYTDDAEITDTLPGVPSEDMLKQEKKFENSHRVD